MSKLDKFYEYDGYVRVDPLAGIVEVLDEDGTRVDLSQAAVGNGTDGIKLTSVYYLRGKIRLDRMPQSETETARYVFARGNR